MDQCKSQLLTSVSTLSAMTLNSVVAGSASSGVKVPSNSIWPSNAFVAGKKEGMTQYHQTVDQFHSNKKEAFIKFYKFAVTVVKYNHYGSFLKSLLKDRMHVGNVKRAQHKIALQIFLWFTT